MKKILLSLGMIVFVGGLVAGMTGAFFSDTETSTGNTFAAGAIDLTIDNTSYGFDWNRPGAVDPSGVWGPNPGNSWDLRDLDSCDVPNPDFVDEQTTPEEDPTIPGPCLFFSFADLKPGDYGEDTISLHVQNDAYACMAFDLTATPENGVNDPEADVPDETIGEDEGELQDYLSFIFWRDDGDNVLEDDETVIEELSGLPGSIFTGELLPIAESGDAPLAAGETTYIGKGWCFGTLTATPEVPGVNEAGPTPGNTGFTCDGTGDHNIAQTDGIVVDVEFTAVQARHNENFLCDPNTAPEATTLTLEKVIQQDGINVVTEALWTLTASSTNTTAFAKVITGVETDPAVTAAPVPPGDYILSETVVGGFTQSNLQCVGGILVGNTVTVALGANAVCTFTNSENPS